MAKWTSPNWTSSLNRRPALTPGLPIQRQAARKLYKRPAPFIVAALALLAILMLSSCATAPNGATATNPQTGAPLSLPPASPEHVSIDSRWACSGSEHRPSTGELLDLARGQVSAGAGGQGLDHLVRQWPDVTLDLLRSNASSPGENQPILFAIASAYDRAFGTEEPAVGWCTVLSVADSGAPPYFRFHQARAATLEQFTAGRVDGAATVDLATTLPPDAPKALRAEAFRLAGIGALLADNPKLAADRFYQAASNSIGGSKHVQFEIGLLVAEAERRNNRPEQTTAAWQAAVTAGADIRDPDLWDRALLLKPQDASWPEEAASAASEEPSFAPGTIDSPTVLIGIGKMRLSRGSPQAALLAFSHAEAEATASGEKELAELYRAQTMIELRQAGSTLPVLDILMKTPDPRIAARASVIEGDLWCRVLNDRARGIPMMRDGLDQSDAGNWPGKDRFTANLALYCILEGKDDEGVRLLHQAQARFEAAGRWDDLANSLKNEAGYLRLIGKTEAADAAQKRADEAARRAGHSQM